MYYISYFGLYGLYSLLGDKKVNIADFTYSLYNSFRFQKIVFYKSNLSSRWWMGVPFKKAESSSLDCYYVACSYEDYEEANRGEIPSRWIKTYNKLS